MCKQKAMNFVSGINPRFGNCLNSKVIFIVTINKASRFSLRMGSCMSRLFHIGKAFFIVLNTGLLFRHDGGDEMRCSLTHSYIYIWVMDFA